MILKRPGGNKPETPSALRQRLARSWPARVKAHLSDEPAGEGEDWPLEVNIGRPRLTGDALVENALVIRDWIESWRTMEGTHHVDFVEQTRRRVGQMRVPEKITFETIDALADYLGKEAVRELRRARARFDGLKLIDPRLAGMAPNWRKVADLSEAEHTGACDFLQQRQYDPDELLSIREMMIAGMDGKFLEKRHAILEDALSHMGMLKEGKDYRERLGFRTDDRQTLWVKAHPDDMGGPFGARQFAVRPSEISHFPASIRQVTIVENIETFFGFEPEPGVCLFFGSGNAIAGMAPEIGVLQDLHVTYWGDLDSFGMKILSRLRRSVPHTVSVMMDEATMTGIAREAWRPEPESDRYPGDIPGLTAPERGALDLIRSGNFRIEQEHLRPGPSEIEALGLRKVS